MASEHDLYAQVLEEIRRAKQQNLTKFKRSTWLRNCSTGLLDAIETECIGIDNVADRGPIHTRPKHFDKQIEQGITKGGAESHGWNGFYEHQYLERKK